nr:MAG TPA: hypothetical protein [Caudoviricetes sp.]
MTAPPFEKGGRKLPPLTKAFKLVYKSAFFERSNLCLFTTTAAQR